VDITHASADSVRPVDAVIDHVGETSSQLDLVTADSHWTTAGLSVSLFACLTWI